MEQLANQRCFGGQQQRYRHRSSVLDCEMTFSVFLPPQADAGAPVPVLYWLSGLTCTDENFVTKAGAQRAAAAHGVAIVAPDTSPRGDDVADDPEGAYDFGLGAGFYVDATQAPYAAHYKMYSYILEELPALIAGHFPVDGERTSIFGHSMGGHGALTLALKNPGRFKSVSAFAPICSPTRCPWGEKALAGYLGEDRDQWAAHDASLLLAAASERLPMRVEQGGADNFLAEQLRPELLQAAAASRDYPLDYREHPGYDHSYFFIASFIDEHIAFHASHLK
ncbi:S-formylglutathione hydrolase [Spongiibacter taiwanensis]|uniref:S-formylglutathione hydrolase n=1 Tax=Spongiibacter taiwanensis TaxID=1748242 RepID=UPI002034D956|nr:S-formylglutathione hydrolase [Spongiibacter taiwanensis]USA43880.1 S-formylglutathione hydrolase [Spongiibacter taiwanensis]